jgi:hypothetical protein
MKMNCKQVRVRMLLAAVAAGSLYLTFCLVAGAQANARPGGASTTPAPPTPFAVARLTSSIHTVGSARGAMRYLQIWGIDNLKLESTASGGLIRFSYRVVDAEKARELNDKKKNPYLLVEKTGTRLGLQTAERVGQLRQVAEPESGRVYWMIFGNSGRLVQPGDRVDIAIGTFHADGLFVEAPQAALTYRK